MLRSSVQTFARSTPRPRTGPACSACRAFASSSRSAQPAATAPLRAPAPAHASRGQDASTAGTAAAPVSATTELLDLFEGLDQISPEQVDPASESSFLPPL